MQVAIWQVIVITLIAFIYRIERYGTDRKSVV